MVVTVQIDAQHRLGLYGSADRHLKTLRELLGVTLIARDDQIKISGEPGAVEHCVAALHQMRRLLKEHRSLNQEHIASAIRLGAPEGHGHHPPLLDVAVSGRSVEPRTAGQRHYVNAMLEQDLVFCAGPAGTGKTFLAVALAVSMLRHNKVRRLVLVRPAVEAGEKLGFLPGDIQAKVNPYLRPLLDALHDGNLDIETLIHPTDLPTLSFLPAGLASHAEATELLASSRMARLATALGENDRERIVVFDSPPLLQTTESAALARVVGQVVVVVRAESTPQPVLFDALKILEGHPGVSLVLNQSVHTATSEYYYYYGDGRAHQVQAGRA
ncbi:MAG: PhoH family protein [Pseudomonadota bacterium]|jgi:Mrp family chromosome partitioning ATPase|nr:PhoH family protein [Pseudomonadota bacterium]